jgi:hypothetical protein
VAITFLPTVICGVLLRVKGISGLLAVAGIIFIGVTLFLDFQGWRQSTGAVAAMVGLLVGGKFSDHRELQRMKRIKAEETRHRDALLKGR